MLISIGLVSSVFSPACAVLDPGASHSFITDFIVELLCKVFQSLKVDLDALFQELASGKIGHLILPGPSRRSARFGASGDSSASNT